jgi:hypothetical protein
MMQFVVRPGVALRWATRVEMDADPPTEKLIHLTALARSDNDLRSASIAVSCLSIMPMHANEYASEPGAEE